MNQVLLEAHFAHHVEQEQPARFHRMLSSTVLTLVVIPAIYSLWKERALEADAARRA